MAREFEAISPSGMATFKIDHAGNIECAGYSAVPGEGDANVYLTLTKAEMCELRDFLVDATASSQELTAAETTEDSRSQDA